MKWTSVFLFLGFFLVILGVSTGYIPENATMPPRNESYGVIQHERSCLISAIYGECRNCSKKEMEAVTEVILNRVKHKKYPSTICEVVKQPKQFSFANNLSSISSIIPEFENMKYLDRKAYSRIESLVDSKVFSGQYQGNRILPVNATHYHTKRMKVYPSWAKKKILVKGIDKKFLHIYYAYID